MHTHRAPATYIRMSARVRSRGNIGTTAPSWAPSELASEDTPQRCLTSLRFNSTSSEMRSREDWSSRNLVASSEFENGSSAEALKRERLAPDEGGNQTQSDAISAEALKRERLAPDEGGNQTQSDAISAEASTRERLAPDEGGNQTQSERLASPKRDAAVGRQSACTHYALRKQSACNPQAPPKRDAAVGSTRRPCSLHLSSHESNERVHA